VGGRGRMGGSCGGLRGVEGGVMGVRICIL